MWNVNRPLSEGKKKNNMPPFDQSGWTWFGLPKIWGDNLCELTLLKLTIWLWERGSNLDDKYYRKQEQLQEIWQVEVADRGKI